MIAAPTAAAGLIRSTAATLDTSLPTGFTEALARAEALVTQVDAGARFAEGDVLADRAAEQEHVLADIGDVLGAASGATPA